jgi:hypothetical protein
LAQYFEYADSGVEVERDGLEEVPFGEFLVDRSALTRAQLFRALCEQDKCPGIPLGEVVAALGFIPPDQVLALLCEYEALAVIEAA